MLRRKSGVKDKFRLVGVALVFLILTSCGDQRETTPGEGPIVEFQRHKHWLYVYAGPKARRTDLARMEMFGKFHPGLSVNEGVRVYGGPDRFIGPERGAEYIEYRNQYGRIRLGSERSADGHVSYPLYFFPDNRRPNTFFPEIIVKHIRPSADKEDVMLFECGFYQPCIHAVIEGGQLQKVVWHGQNDLEPRSDPSKCTN